MKFSTEGTARTEDQALDLKPPELFKRLRADGSTAKGRRQGEGQELFKRKLHVYLSAEKAESDRRQDPVRI
jgi:hypothetical protein